MKTVDYKKYPPVINITKPTMDVLLKQNKPDQLIALYIFYCYTAVWQNTLRVRTTTKYTAKGIGWSEQKVRRIKKRLADFGLIEDVQTTKKDGLFGKRYVRVYYFTVPGKTPSTVKPRVQKCLVTGNKKCLVTGSRNLKSCDRKTIVTSFDKIAATKLKSIVLSHKNVNIKTTLWPNTFRLLRTEDKISKKRIKAVIYWYAKHIGNDFIPVAYSARTFRDKFLRLETAMRRQADERNKKDGNGEIEFRRGRDGNMGYYDKE
jgi:hypothetical protein